MPERGHITHGILVKPDDGYAEQSVTIFDGHANTPSRRKKTEAKRKHRSCKLKALSELVDCAFIFLSLFRLQLFCLSGMYKSREFQGAADMH